MTASVAIRLQYACDVISPRATALIASLAVATPILAASFILPDDEDFARRAPAIVVASPLASRVDKQDDGTIVTITTMSIEEVIKGDVLRETIDVVEPGGVPGADAMLTHSVPRFEDGRRYLLFLMPAHGQWHVLALIVGEFEFQRD